MSTSSDVVHENTSSTFFTRRTFNLDQMSATTVVLSTHQPDCTVINSSAFQFRDESRDVVSAQTSNVLNNVVHVVLFPLLFFIGFPTNLVNIAVFFKHGLKQRINLCLFCLSVLDLVFVTVAFLVYVEKMGIEDFTLSSMEVGHVSRALINNHLFGVYSGASLSSQFTSAVIAGERCLCVVWPLRFNSLLKTRTLGTILLIGFVLIFVGRFVVSMKYAVICVVDGVTGLTSFLVTGSEFYRLHRNLVVILDSLIFGLCLPVSICGFVIITTAITAANLQKSTEFQKESTSTSTTLSSRNVAVTKMLIYLSLQFVLLNLPNMLFRVSLSFLPELITSGDWANLYFLLLAVTELCAVLNSSLNFLVYYFCGSKYRETVSEMFCCKWNRGK